MEFQQAQQFLSDLVGAGQTAIAFDELQSARNVLLDKFAFEIGLDREKIRAGMTFSTVDAKGRKQEKSIDEEGQEHAVDTIGSTAKGHGLSAEDNARVNNTWTTVMKFVNPVIAQFTTAYVKAHKIGKFDFEKPIADDDPDKLAKQKLREDEENKLAAAREEIRRFVENEVFTPLVREQLIPETFVPDNYSAIQQLLNHTFDSFKLRLKENEAAQKMTSAIASVDIHGGGGKKGRIAAMVAKKDELGNDVKKGLNIKDRDLAFANAAKEGVTAGIALAQGAVAINRWVPNEGNISALDASDRLLDPRAHLERIDPDRLTDYGKNLSDDEVRFALEQQVREDLLVNFLAGSGLSAEDLDKLVTAIEIPETNEAFYSLSSLDEVAHLIGTTAETIGVTLDSLNLTASFAAAERGSLMRKEAVKFVPAVDLSLASALGGVAGQVFSGMYRRSVDMQAIFNAMTSGAKGDVSAVDVVQALANGFESAFQDAASVVSNLSANVLIATGKLIASGFSNQAPLQQLANPDVKPADAFNSLLKVADSAIQAGMNDELREVFRDSQCMSAIVAKSVLPDAETLQEDLDAADEEIREYERQLTLIDEGGLAVAELKSIEKLIAQLKTDRHICETVASLGTSLLGIGSGATSIANWAADAFTEVVAGSVLGPLEVAKLILQLGVNVYQATKRWELWNKFEQELKRSKKATSSLTSTIQGFYDNKVEQITFHTIEDALLAVRAAAAIVGSVPTPFTLAIGKTVGTVALAAEGIRKVSEVAYNAKKLHEAWNTIHQAVNQPGDRALGLAALRLSPTLGMHAIAWAGMEKTPPDPIARRFMDATGLNENTLAAGATETKVREYLETLLFEDRQTLDPLELKVNWAPVTFKMSQADWVIINHRAEIDAHPRLRPGGGKPVMQALKLTDKHDLKQLAEDAQNGQMTDDVAKRVTAEAADLLAKLSAFESKATDNTDHAEMQSIVDHFVELAYKHKNAIGSILKL